MVGISQSTFAVVVVAFLLGLFLLFLLASLARARRSDARRAATAEGAAPGRPAVRAERTPRPKTVVTRRDFLRGSLLASLGVFTAQFGGATIAFLWPSLKGGFGGKVNAGKLADITASFIEKKAPFYVPEARSYLQPLPRLGAAQGREDLRSFHRGRDGAGLGRLRRIPDFLSHSPPVASSSTECRRTGGDHGCDGNRGRLQGAAGRGL